MLELKGIGWIVSMVRIIDERRASKRTSVES